MTVVAEGRLPLRLASPGRALRALAPTAFLVDFSMIAVAGVAAALGRDRLSLFDPAPLRVGDQLGFAGPLILGVWLAVMWLTGAYATSVFGAGTEEFRRVLHASLLTAGVVGIGCYLAKFSLSRGFVLLLFAVGVPALVLGREVLRRAVAGAHRRGALLQRVLIAGTAEQVDEVARVLRRESWLGYDVVGALVPGGGPDVAPGIAPGMAPGVRQTAAGVPVVGGPGEVRRVVDAVGADVIFLAGGALDSGQQLRRLVWDLEDDDVAVVVAPSVTDVSPERVRVRPVGGLPLIHIDKPRAVHASRLGKRAFDLVGSALLLTVLSPLLLLAAAAVWWHDGGPVLFGQERTGRDGARFRCLKFRSMVVDAETRLAELHRSTGYDGGLFKMAEDPRVTRPGRWLRRFSVDELPQLVNVLRGEMSLVGPRPPLPQEVAAYADETSRRLRVRPGMTGLWQVSGRSDLSYDEAIRLDLFYVDNWSMIQDLAILLRTLGAVVRSRGAY